MDCIFCKIVKKEIPSGLVLETEKLIVIKDINPEAPTHLLIIPKTHYSTLLDCNDKEVLSDMLIAAKDVAKKLGVDNKGFRLVINTNRDGGQIVMHLHIHLLAGKSLKGEMG